MSLRLGLYDHFGWAVAVTATPDLHVVDRRRIELVGADVCAAPIHYEREHLDAEANAALVDVVRDAIRVTGAAAFDQLEADLTEPVGSIALRDWPDDFPTDIETLRRPPWEARADAVMYRQELARLATERGWAVVRYDAKEALARAVAHLGDDAEEVLQGPRRTLGAPWTKDHRVALAATLT